MSVALVTGSCGLVGAECVDRFVRLGLDVVGVDNDMRQALFGREASTQAVGERLRRAHRRYRHVDLDVRAGDDVRALVRSYGRDLTVVVHTAAQPSHDWAGAYPRADFEINALGTLNVLEALRLEAPEALLIFTSSNKVYGDHPNRLPLVEHPTRWEVESGHPAHAGIDEHMPLDGGTHSPFGVSKAAADLMVQEYGRYFGLKTVVFRAGCLTGPQHAGTRLHGFLAYLVRCAMTGTPYTVIGYKGKQVRDNLHSADLVRAFELVIEEPKAGEVYNIGGGREVNCSVLEAVEACRALTGRRIDYDYDPQPRVGDHVWYVSDLTKFRLHYPTWRIEYDLDAILRDIADRRRDGGTSA